MAKETKKSNSTEKVSLPYDATIENMDKVIDAIKRKPGDEAAIKAICSIVTFSVNRKSLELLKIANGYNLTELGEKIAYSTDGKSKYYLEAIMAYPPYELLLTHLQSKVGGLDTFTTADTIRSFWGLSKFGNTESNRERAVATFGSFIELAGIGKLIVGRAKNPTRIEWAPTALSSIEQYQQIPAESKDEPATSADSLNIPANDKSHSQEGTPTPIPQPKFNQNYMNSHIVPQISIEINMDDWEIDKIKSFFKYVYGDFSDD